MVVPLGEQQTTWLCIKFKKKCKNDPPYCTMYTVLYSVHKIQVKYTHTPHNKLLNTADRISDVVFFTASCFLG